MNHLVEQADLQSPNTIKEQQETLAADASTRSLREEMNDHPTMPFFK
jgi:hypothetical protein